MNSMEKRAYNRAMDRCRCTTGVARMKEIDKNLEQRDRLREVMRIVMRGVQA